ncbi:hypothetical protein E1B28_012673 [Marasmius oreades]|uniref:Uncharacterized protein n=1 Tax=Marasmius oreades TaxID=181124 RepID=A0A9P7RSP4_9AGAR|nr:uncharacterized protein E1B28_012673 [Marasmius oreades]KAG7088703.1 hypothetical protein E1B28_012673 [Marasmius oreades]
MIILNQEAGTDKSLPPPPPESKEEEAARARKAERERTTLRRGQSSRSYMEPPPPSYEAVESVALESQSAFTPTSSSFARPSPSRSPPSPGPQFPQFGTSSHGLPLPPARRTLAHSSSYSNLRPHLNANRSGTSLNRPSSAYLSTPTLVPRSLDFFPTVSPIPLASYSTTTLSTVPYASTLSVNTISPDIPTTTSSSPSNSPPIPVPTFTPSAKKSFFSTQAGNKKRNAKEAKLFVLSQITTLLQNQTTPQYNVDAHKSILRSCADACSTHKLYLPAILQEKFVEDHTPFYWSIVQRPFSTSSKIPDLLQALLIFGSPLAEETRMDVGRACLMVNDPKLHQALRVNRYFMGSGTAEGALSPQPIYKDRVVIEDKGGGTSGGNGEFAATLEIEKYKERPVIHVEFIAQRRLWRLSIRKPSNTKKWKLAISLLEQSPATYVDSRFILQSVNEPPAPSRSNSFPSGPPQPVSPSRTVSDVDDAMSVSTGSGSGSGSSSSGSTMVPPSYGYGVPSAFVAAAYSGYSPEKIEMAQNHHQRSRSMASPSMNALSFYPDVVKGSTSAIRDRQESFHSLPNVSPRKASTSTLMSSSNWSVDDENLRNGSGSGSGGDGPEGEGDEFLISTHDLPPLPANSVLKEVRLKSNSMISPGKKEIEVEVEIDTGIDKSQDGREKTMRARFEARLAKPESECVIC